MDETCPFCKQDHLTRWISGLTSDEIEDAISREISKVKKSKRSHIERHIRNVIEDLKKTREYYDSRTSC